MSFRLSLAVSVGLIGWLSPFAIVVAQPVAKSQGQRFAEALASVIRIVADEHVKPATQAELAAWAIHGLFEEFKKPVPRELVRRLAKLKNPKASEMRQLLRDAYAAVIADKADRSQKAIDVCAAAIFRKLEPRAYPGEGSGVVWWEFGCEFYPTIRVGIGLKLKTDPGSGMLRVVTPILNGPAYQAGIRAGDLITHIRIKTDDVGKPLARPKELSTKGMTAERAQELFLGPPGTALSLTVVRSR